ncbi:MAG: hypothetical protein IT449_06005 [Phycisphaerales bacterium]|nr:hypothetical protein [Phycisphaerales bacterium]
MNRVLIIAVWAAWAGGSAGAAVREEFRAGHALSFDGRTARAVVPDIGAAPAGSSFTVECWCSTPDVEPRQRLVSKWSDAADGGREYTLEFWDGQLVGRVAGSNGADAISVHAKTVTPEKWTHVGVVLDGGAGELRLYVNGRRVSAKATSVSADLDSTEPVLFGAGLVGDGGEMGAFYNGTLDEVRLWSLALSDADMLEQFDRQAPFRGEGLAGYWRLDESSGEQAVFDYSGHDRHGWLGESHEGEAGDPLRVTSTAPIRPDNPRGDAGGAGHGDKLFILDTDGDRLWDVWESHDGDYSGITHTGTDPNNPDTDGDGLKDGDEILGTLAGLNLPALGSHPVLKDIFLEIDWAGDATGGSHTHEPPVESVQMLIDAFAASPVVNPYGLPQGIRLHVDHGQGGVFTGGNFLGNDGMIGFDDEFNVYKAAHFDPLREDLFHYTIFCHAFNSGGNSGIAELPGDDFIVASDVWYGNALRVATVCMHELGHNLFLRHGGFEDKTYKPNYNSVMNYRYTFPGTDTNCDAVGDGGVNYSDGSLADLPEAELDENVGVCGNTPVDWNGDGRIKRNLQRNINCIARLSAECGTDNGVCDDRVCTTLRDSNDWAALRLPIPRGDAPFQEITDCRMRLRHPRKP